MPALSLAGWGGGSCPAALGIFSGPRRTVLKVAALQGSKIRRPDIQSQMRGFLISIPWGGRVSHLKGKEGLVVFWLDVQGCLQEHKEIKLTKGLDYCTRYKSVVRPIDLYSQVFVT